MIDVSIIVVNFRTYGFTKNTVNSAYEVMKNSNYTYEIIVVDNFSQDGSFEKLQILENDNIKVFETDKNGGFGYGNNYGVEKSEGRYLFFLNSDTILYSDILPEMLFYMDRNKNVGALSCLMEDGKYVPLVVGHSFENARTLFVQTIIKPLIPMWLKKRRGERSHVAMKGCVAEYDWVSGAAILIPRKVFNKVGGWNKVFFLYMEDEELCYRIRQAGYRIQVYPKVGLQHFVGKSGGSAFVAYEKYKSEIIYFKMTMKRNSWFINQLLYIQAWQYMRKIDRKTKRKVIKKLRSIADE